MKYIAILGSTGSIGTQTLEVVRAQQDIKVTALSAGDNIDLLERQIREFKPVLAAVKTEEKAKELIAYLLEEKPIQCIVESVEKKKEKKHLQMHVMQQLVH